MQAVGPLAGTYRISTSARGASRTRNTVEPLHRREERSRERSAEEGEPTCQKTVYTLAHEHKVHLATHMVT